jgi:hypothetical protein
MITILTDPAVGGTFLTWTVYYLTGKTHYFSARLDKIVKLPNSPLTTNNAHKFIPNQPRNIKDIDCFLPVLANKDECVYMHQFNNNTEEAVTKLLSCSTKTIILSMNNNQALYQCKHQVRNATTSWNDQHQRMLVDPDEIYEDLVNYFFKESKQTWAGLGLTDIWDKREFIALNFNPFQHDSILNYVDNTKQYYYVNTMDIWTNFDQSVYEIFRYLDLSIDEQRYQSWLPVYSQWKKYHADNVKFVWYFDPIIDSILKGTEFDLTRFNLDIRQEAAIQHALIYKHNLNLKTWKLEKFTNTKQLYDLLEPNIHNLTKSLLS